MLLCLFARMFAGAGDVVLETGDKIGENAPDIMLPGARRLLARRLDSKWWLFRYTIGWEYHARKN